MTSGPTVLHHDNLVSISCISEIQDFLKVKHVAILYHYVRGEVETETVRVDYFDSAKTCAALLTKVLVGVNSKLTDR